MAFGFDIIYCKSILSSDWATTLWLTIYFSILNVYYLYNLSRPDFFVSSWVFSLEWHRLRCVSRQLMCVFVSLPCACSRPLKTCLWALVGWTKVDPLLSLLMATTCPLRGWSAVALQPHTCRTRWMDRCLVSDPPQHHPKRPSLVSLSLSPSSPTVPVSLGLPSNTTEPWGRSLCWRMMSPVCQLWWSWTCTPFDYVYALLLNDHGLS